MNAPALPEAAGPNEAQEPSLGYVTGGQYGTDRLYIQHPQSYTEAHSVQAQDSGRTLGIISLVGSLATFLGFNVIGPVIGIITGHLARKNSRAAGLADNEFGKWGLWLGIVFLGFWLLSGLIGVSIGALTGLFGLAAGW